MITNVLPFMVTRVERKSKSFFNLIESALLPLTVFGNALQVCVSIYSVYHDEHAEKVFYERFIPKVTINFNFLNGVLYFLLHFFVFLFFLTFNLLATSYSSQTPTLYSPPSIRDDVQKTLS